MATCDQLYGYTPEWDTGYCIHCKQEFTEEERTHAVHGVVKHGMTMLYMHQRCWNLTHPLAPWQ